MNTGRAIIAAALILALGYVLGNLYKLAPSNSGDLPVVYRINTITGTVTMCAGKC